MSSAEWDKLEKNLSRIGQMASLLRLVIGAGVAVVMSIAAVIVWVNQTTTALASTQTSLMALESKRDASLKEWGDWRGKKDEQDIRQTISLENLQKLIDRQQQMIDRLDARK